MEELCEDFGGLDKVLKEVAEAKNIIEAMSLPDLLKKNFVRGVYCVGKEYKTTLRCPICKKDFIFYAPTPLIESNPICFHCGFPKKQYRKYWFLRKKIKKLHEYKMFVLQHTSELYLN